MSDLRQLPTHLNEWVPAVLDLPVTGKWFHSEASEKRSDMRLHSLQEVQKTRRQLLAMRMPCLMQPQLPLWQHREYRPWRGFMRNGRELRSAIANI